MMRPIQLTLVCVVLFAVTEQVQASLILTINTYTTDELTFTLSGTLDADTIGTSPGYLAIKNDWSNNVGSHTEMFNSLPTIGPNTIQIGGFAPSTTAAVDNPTAQADCVYFINPSGGIGSSILAGTVVSGSLTLTGSGAFNPADMPTLQLVSGWSMATGDWARFEASVVPEPATLLLMLMAVPALAWGYRRRKKSQL